MGKINYLIITLFIFELLFINAIISYWVYISHYYQFYLFFNIHYKSIIVYNLSWILISYINRFYKFPNQQTLIDALKKICKQFIIFSLILYSITAFRDNPIMNKWDIVKITIIIFCYIFILRLLFLNYLKKIRLNNITEKIFLVGTNESYNQALELFKKPNIYGIKIFGDNISYNLNDSKNDIYLLKSKSLLNCIYILLNDDLRENVIKEWMIFCENNLIGIKFIPSQKSFLAFELDSFYIDNINLIQYKSLPFENDFLLFLKRIFDLSFSLLVLVTILWWIIPLISLLIKLTSKGPVFYLQKRIGKDEKLFNIIKFRTMKINAEHLGPKLASDNDNRITSIGKILRKYRIDELPQFINVLKGEMSIVGPRPEREYFINEIIKINPRYKKLHNIKPGITSLGQVYYGYAENIKEMNQRLQFDLLYLKHFNILLDIKIILLTIVVVLKGKGK